MGDAVRDLGYLLALMAVGLAVGLVLGTSKTNGRWSEWRGCLTRPDTTVEWCGDRYHPPTPIGADREP